MMRSESVWRRDSSRSRSDARSLPTGMPVRSETTAATSCRVRLTVRWARRAASWRRTSVRSSSPELRRLLILRVRHSLLKLLLELLLALACLRRLRPAEPDVRRALVEQVERLVRQEAICQIAA